MVCLVGEYREEARLAPRAAAPDTGRFLRRMENESEESDQPGRPTPAGAMRRPTSDPWRRRAWQKHPVSAKVAHLFPITLSQHLVHAAWNSKSTLKLRL
jgi:hypothetical protein